MNSLDLPLSESCDNCNGYGDLRFDQVTEHIRNFCEKNNFALLADESHCAICLLCNGTGQKPYETLELE